MLFYRRKTGRQLHGFGDPVAAVPLAGLTLADRQREAVEKAGVQIVDIEHPAEVSGDGGLMFDEDLYFSSAAAKFVARHAMTAGGPVNYVFEDNAFNRRFCLPPDAQPVAERFDSGLRLVRSEGAAAEQVVIPQAVLPNHGTLPPQLVPGGRHDLDQCDTMTARMVTPFHLLQANLYVLLSRGLWLRRMVPRWMERGSKYRDSRMFFSSLRLLNRRGRGCKIHPTAVLEGVELGDNVTIGAYAVVRMARIGSGTTIEDQASVTYSVLGENNFIANKNHLAFCMTYDDVFLIHGPYQFSIFGRSSAVFATINGDVRMDQKTIRIKGPDGIIDSRQHLLGVAYGHGAKVAGGNIIPPGRAIPNGFVELPPDFMLR